MPVIETHASVVHDAYELARLMHVVVASIDYMTRSQSLLPPIDHTSNIRRLHDEVVDLVHGFIDFNDYDEERLEKVKTRAIATADSLYCMIFELDLVP